MGTILTTIRWLSIFTGALSLLYLGHAWFEVGLSEVFHRIYAWYAGILHPVVELMKPLSLWLVGLLGWSLPVWWEDAVVLYLTMGGSTARGRNSYLVREFGHPIGDSSEVRGTRETGALWAMLRFFVWPFVLVWAFFRDFPPGQHRIPVGTRVQYLLRGYVGTSLFEFSKILAGALMFAGLNAGLG